MSIFIFSKPIHSGKTTELKQWCELQKDVAGVLMPDINGQRHILNIQTKETFIVQCDDPSVITSPLINIGRYHFYTAAFEKANSILLQEDALQREWLIVDEVGKLEMDGNGFYPALQRILHSNNSKNLLLVVRDSLCDAVISQFAIKEPRIIHRLGEI